jgi:hypothetical protein
MTHADLRAAAQRIVEAMVRDHPAEAAVLASLLLSELLSIGLFGGDEGEVDEFVLAVNVKLSEVALHHGAPSTWRLVPAETPKRH